LDLGKYKSDSAWSTNKWYPSWSEVIGIIFTFSVVTFAWIFFRAETLGDAVNYIKHINLNFGNQFRSGLIYVAGFLILDFLYSMAALEKYKQNSITLVILTLFILNYWNASGDNFIYFQF
jgi:D-alanyl-lipoteichoic acid acyltransferase DltB (MBOAT superfamily)